MSAIEVIAHYNNGLTIVLFVNGSTYLYNKDNQINNNGFMNHLHQSQGGRVLL